jgi:hypothetical protein
MNLNEIPLGDEQLPPPKLTRPVIVAFDSKEKADRMVLCLNAHDELVETLACLVRQCHAYADSDDMDLPNTYAASLLLEKLEGGAK